MRWARRVLSHPAFTGISRRHLHLLISEVYPVWLARREGWLHTRRGGQRRHAAGAGRCARLRFADRLLVTLAHLRLAVPHDALAVVFGVDRFTLTRAIGQGPAVAGQPRLRAALRDPATHPGRRVRLRRRRRRHAAHGRHRDPGPPTAGAGAFVSGKAKQNTIKTTLSSDADGATLWCKAHRPGRHRRQNRGHRGSAVSTHR